MVLAVKSGAQVSTASIWQLTRCHAWAGYALGCRHPALELTLKASVLEPGSREALWDVLMRACPGLGPLAPPPGEWVDGGVATSASWLLAVWLGVQQTQGLPVFEVGRVLVSAGSEVTCLLPVASRSHRAVAQLVLSTLQWLQVDVASVPGKPDRLQVSQALTGAAAALTALMPRSSNVPRFLKAAFALGLQTLMLPGGVVQYGVASRARWLDSTFTDETPTIAAKLARNKHWASALLAQAGLPVPPQALVTDADQAAHAARRLGYPVVVKPADLDGGVGVGAGLDNEQEVREAFAAARQHSGQIVVEKHIHGRDYRLTVFKGEVVWTIERVPAGVWGTGQDTVTQLVARVNSDPRRGAGPHAQLKRLVLDDEGVALLRKQGLHAHSVPRASQFVRLRRAANVASGGEPVAVNEQVHPDNARLAVRAAQALGLDVAGIDLLIGDVSRSWLESGANVAICEVNGQPQLGQTTAAHLYGQLLERLVKGDGRVPIVLVLGAEHPERWGAALATALQARGLSVGIAGQEGVFVGSEPLTATPTRLMAAGRMLALNRRVDAMVVCVAEDSVLRTGLPWARYDALVLAGRHWPRASQVPSPPQGNPARLWLQHLLPACDGVVVAHHAAGLRVEDVDRLTPARWIATNASIHETAELAVRWALREAGGRT